MGPLLVAGQPPVTQRRGPHPPAGTRAPIALMWPTWTAPRGGSPLQVRCSEPTPFRDPRRARLIGTRSPAAEDGHLGGVPHGLFQLDEVQALVSQPGQLVVDRHLRLILLALLATTNEAL